jgi:hypothetical protein
MQIEFPRGGGPLERLCRVMGPGQRVESSRVESREASQRVEGEASRWGGHGGSRWMCLHDDGRGVGTVRDVWIFYGVETCAHG